MMDFRQHQTAQQIVGEALHRCRQLGIDTDRANGGNQLMSVMAEALRSSSGRALDSQRGRARAFDLVRRDELQVNPADEYDDEGRGLDQEDLGALREILELGLQRYKPGGETHTFIRKLRDALDGFLQRATDVDGLHGKSFKDMEREPARNAFKSWEDGATVEDRKYLARGRRLAARAADRAPAGRSFLGSRPMPGSDLERMENAAALTFNL